MTGVFDFHTHILPGIDDGSRSVEESLAMIDELIGQGAKGIAATSHFYAQHMTPEDFFTRRQEAWELLIPHLSEDAPEIRLGAEVMYFEGIHRYEQLERFCLHDSSILLVEMPMQEWTSRMVSALLEINRRGDMVVLLAHIERYLPYHNKKAMERMLENGVLMQASTEFVIAKPAKAVKMLKQGRIHFLGTDCHNMGSRKPNMKQALEIIRGRAGNELIHALNEREARYLYEDKT